MSKYGVNVAYLSILKKNSKCEGNLAYFQISK